MLVFLAVHAWEAVSLWFRLLHVMPIGHFDTFSLKHGTSSVMKQVEIWHKLPEIKLQHTNFNNFDGVKSWEMTVWPNLPIQSDKFIGFWISYRSWIHQIWIVRFKYLCTHNSWSHACVWSCISPAEHMGHRYWPRCWPSISIRYSHDRIIAPCKV